MSPLCTIRRLSTSWCQEIYQYLLSCTVPNVAGRRGVCPGRGYCTVLCSRLFLVSVQAPDWRSLANTVISSQLSSIICLLICYTTAYRYRRSVIWILLSSFYKFASQSANPCDRAVGVRNIDHKSLKFSLRLIPCLHSRIRVEKMESARKMSILEYS